MDNILSLPLWINGVTNLSWWEHVLVALGLTHMTIISVTIYLHRYSAHRSLNLNPVIAHFFRFWLWLTTGMSTKGWTATHRKHHAKCEEPEDPHSPKVFGIKKVFFEGSELYRRESVNKCTLEKYGHGTPNDWIEKNIYTPRSTWGVTLMLIINLGLFGVGSFLCFIVAVSQSLDRLLIGGIFLLLLTFANQKIISKFFSSND